MNGRIKLLAFGLAGLLCVPLAERAIVRTLLEPIRQRERRVTHLEAEIQRAEAQCARIDNAQRKLEQWTSQSLPPDPSTASALYQNWLLDLATKAELDNVIVTPNRVVCQEGSYYRIPFALQARAKLDRLCDFLGEFYRVDLLHRISQIRLEAVENGDDPTLEIALHLEGAALPIATPRSTLFPDAKQPRSRAEDPERDGTAHEQIVNRNLFVKSSARVKPKTSKDNEVPVASSTDHAAQVYLIALLTHDDQREAWLYDRMASRQLVLTQGSSFDMADISGCLSVIDRDFVLIDMRGVTWRLELGHNLRQMTRGVTLSNL